MCDYNILYKRDNSTLDMFRTNATICGMEKNSAYAHNNFKRLVAHGKHRLIAFGHAGQRWAGGVCVNSAYYTYFVFLYIDKLAKTGGCYADK